MASLRQFAERMRELGRRVETNTPRLVRRTALAIDQTVVLGTPVDTGTARSNWQVQINGPVTETREAAVPGENGSTAGPNAQIAIEEGREVIDTYRGEGQEIYISNPIPYIDRLNDGSSAQAPAGFVEQAVQTGVDAISRARLLEEDG